MLKTRHLLCTLAGLIIPLGAPSAAHGQGSSASPLALTNPIALTPQPFWTTLRLFQTQRSAGVQPDYAAANDLSLLGGTGSTADNGLVLAETALMIPLADQTDDSGAVAEAGPSGSHAGANSEANLADTWWQVKGIGSTIPDYAAGYGTASHPASVAPSTSSSTSGNSGSSTSFLKYSASSSGLPSSGGGFSQARSAPGATSRSQRPPIATKPPTNFPDATNNVWAGTGTNKAWLTGSNWSLGHSPNSSEVAQFDSTTNTDNRVELFLGTGITVTTQGIELTSNRANPISVGSAGTGGQTGTLQLNGTTINGVPNTILHNDSAYLLTILDHYADVSGPDHMQLALGNTTDNVINIDGAGGITIDAVITGSSNKHLTLGGSGTGTLMLLRNNSYSGGTTVNAATLSLSGSGTLGSTSATLEVNGGTLDLGGTSQTVGNFTGTGGTVLNNGGGGSTLTIGNGDGTGGNYQGVIADHTSGSGTVALTKTGTGTITLSGTNTFSGGVNINAGALSVSNVGNSGSSSTLGTNGTINFGDNTATLTYTGSGETTNKVINMTGGDGGGAVIDQSGSGALKFTSNLTTENGIKTLTLQGSTAGTGEIAGNIPNAGGSGNSLAVVKNGTGTWILSGTNTYTGATTVSGGMLALTTGASLPGGIGFTGGTSHLTIDGGVLGANGTFSRGVSTSGGNKVDFAPSNASSAGFAGFGTAAGFSASNNLTVLLNNSNAPIDWEATTFLGSGDTLVLGNADANGTVDLQNSLNLTTTGATTRVVQTDRSSIAAATDIDAKLSGVLSGGSQLIKTGAGTLALTGTNTYTGGTQINAGSLLANNSSGSATGTGAVTVNNSSTVLGGTGAISGAVTVNANSRLQGGDGTTGTTLSLGGALTLADNSIVQLALGASGAHSTLARTGSGTWTFDNNQAFTFIDLGATTGSYDNIITGLASDPGTTADWIIMNAGWTGTFTWDGANIDLNLTAVPEPGTWAAGALALLAIGCRLRRHASRKDIQNPEKSASV